MEVSCSRPHAGIRIPDKPPLNSFAAQVGQRRETTLGGDSLQATVDVPAVVLRRAIGFELHKVSFDVFGERRLLVLGNGVLDAGHHPRLDQFGPMFQVGEHGPGRPDQPYPGRLLGCSWIGHLFSSSIMAQSLVN